MDTYFVSNTAPWLQKAGTEMSMIMIKDIIMQLPYLPACGTINVSVYTGYTM